MINAQFYQVGGSVRDEILGLDSKDVDYSVVAPSYEHMKGAIQERGGKIFLETPEFFTIRAHVPSLGACDYVLARRDGDYSDGRRPDEVYAGSLEDDLARRDFTMNAIAKSENGQYIDPFGGVNDINDKVIRCVGDCEKRFEEDGIRILRAIRFSITKSFSVDKQIDDFIMEHKMEHYLRGVSQERVREELVKMFKHDTLQSISLLSMYGLMPILFKDGLWLEPTSKGRK